MSYRDIRDFAYTPPTTERKRTPGITKDAGVRLCPCGKTISVNKLLCKDCKEREEAQRETV